MTKKGFPYIVGSVVLLVLVVVLLMASRTRRLDERITLRQRDKIPYGTAVAKHLLPTLFPRAGIHADFSYPGLWKNIDADGANQAVILVADYFNADKAELEQLGYFVSRGNVVFLMARAMSEEAVRFFRIRMSSDLLFFQPDADSLQVQLNKPPFAADSVFVYPGKRHDGRFYVGDAGTIAMLGKNSAGGTNFIQLNKGSGRFYLHASPLAFSNYFILHKQNIHYYQQALSVIPPNTKVVVWNEYYLQKQDKPSQKGGPNWLGGLMAVPAFRWGLLTALLFLVLFVLLEMRRKQRVIPPHDRPKNDSLDFVQTLGRLYYDRGDHRNLAEKMSAHFLEHVRLTYKVSTNTLDEHFCSLLHAKSGYAFSEINNLIASVNEIREEPAISEERLALFHQQLELFYQNT